MQKKIQADNSIPPESFLYLPPRASTVTHEEILRRNSNPSPLIFAVPEIDSRFNPPVPGEVVTILARPGHGKTTLMVALSKLWAALIKQKPKSKKPPIIVYATWEVTVEEFIATYISGSSGQSLADIGRGQADMQRINDALIDIQGGNFAVFGQSSRQENSYKLGAGATLYDLFLAIKILQEDYDVQGVLIDYLQCIPDLDRQTHSDRKEAVVSDNMGRIRSIAKNLNVPVWLVAQASRAVDDKSGVKFPEMVHAQWTSTIEQDSHKVLSITKLSDYLPIGSEFKVRQRDGTEATYIVNEYTMGIKMLKQRFGTRDDRDIWFLEMYWHTGTYMLQQPVSVGSPTIDY